MIIEKYILYPILARLRISVKLIFKIGANFEIGYFCDRIQIFRP